MRLRNVLLILGLIGLAVVVILNIHQLKNFINILGTLKWYVLILVVIVQLFGYYLNALYYRSILRIFDYKNVGLFRLFEGAMAANFVNYVVPSAGIAGIGFFSQVLSPEVPRGKGALVQAMRYGLSALAVLVMLPVGIGLIVLTRPESKSVDRVAITASLAILAFAMLLVALIHQETLARQAIKKLSKRLKRLFSKFDEQAIDRFVDDFFIGYRSIIKKKKNMLGPFGWSLVYILEEMLTLYMAFVAFGKFVNPGVVIMGYLLANISSTIGGVLFSVGVFELGMVGTFVALGVPFVLSLSITLVYRVMNLIIGLPPGFVFYHRFLPKTKS